MHDTTVIILCCALATYMTRFGGHLLMSWIGTINHRVSAALSAIPIAVLSALVAPSLFSKGPAEAIAIILTGLVALRASLMLSVCTGMIALVVLRAILTHTHL